MRAPASERLIILVISAVQFVNILDFVMVMPLGPDFSTQLHFPSSQVGWLGLGYTGAAAVAGLAGSLVLDRFDRRQALLVALVGLVVGTALGAWAESFEGLVLTRVVAGFFGGPATSVALAIIADVVPAERRGRALGVVMGAFAVASVLGIPLALRLATWGGWQLPFTFTAGVGLAVALATFVLLPPLVGHLDGERRTARVALGELVRIVSRREVQLSYAMTATVMTAGFIIIPILSPYAQFNFRYPREDLDQLYLFGGVVSFLTTRYGGRAVDRWGSFRVSLLAVTALLPVQYTWLVAGRELIPLPAIFMVFMFGMGLRNVSHSTLTSLVPAPIERARFASVQSAVQHTASAMAALATTLLVVEDPRDKSLLHVARLGWISMGLTLVIPALMFVVEARVRRPARA